MAATLDQISGGRLIHFMDCGYMGREYTAYGFEWDNDLDMRVAKLAEATDLILRLWSADGPLTYRGEHYAVTDAVCNPVSAPATASSALVRRGDPRRARSLRSPRSGLEHDPGRYPGAAPPDRVAAEACERAGRDLAEIELSLETQILIAPDIATLRERLRTLAELAETHGQSLPPEIQPFLHTYAADADFRAFVAGESDELPGPHDRGLGRRDAGRRRRSACAPTSRKASAISCSGSWTPRTPPAWNCSPRKSLPVPKIVSCVEIIISAQVRH